MATSDQDKTLTVAFAHALGALTLAALLLVAGFAIYASWQTPEGANTSLSRTIKGRDLVARMGQVETDGDAVIITGMQNYQDREHALVTQLTNFRAENYPYVRYELDGINAGQLAKLLWRTARDPQQLFTTPIPRNFERTSTFKLTNNADWRGTITEIGIHLDGGLRDTPVGIAQLTLEPYSWQGMLAAAWSEWTSFRGWTGRSINFLKGTPGPPGSETLSPALAAAMWAAIAMLLLYLSTRRSKRDNFAAYGAAVLVPWIALDLLWQQELNTQLEETKYLFSGKTPHQRHMVDIDSQFYSFASRLKQEVLPPENQRIFLLHDSEGLVFERLKTQYYLLPHNVYNYGRFPKPRATRPGDYILVLGVVPGLVFDDTAQLLRWGKNKKLRVELVDKDEKGSLYRAMARKREQIGATGDPDRG